MTSSAGSHRRLLPGVGPRAGRELPALRRVPTAPLLTRPPATSGGGRGRDHTSTNCSQRYNLSFTANGSRSGVRARRGGHAWRPLLAGTRANDAAERRSVDSRRLVGCVCRSEQRGSTERERRVQAGHSRLTGHGASGGSRRFEPLVNRHGCRPARGQSDTSRDG